jgi:hypothetical protein
VNGSTPRGGTNGTVLRTVGEVLGICVERRVDLGNAVLAVLGMLGLVSLLPLPAAERRRELSASRRVQREPASYSISIRSS